MGNSLPLIEKSSEGPQADLRAYRARHNLTLKQLAARIGSHPPAISDYENHKRRPSPETAQSIERVTGIPWTAWFESVDPAEPLPSDEVEKAEQDEVTP